MKLVILFVILANVISFSLSASSIPWSFGKCKAPNVVRDFNIQKFFVGRWYEQKSIGDWIYKGSGVCPTLLSKENSNGDIDIKSYVYSSLLNSYLSLDGQIDSNYLETNVGFLIIKLNILGGLLPVKIPSYIVGTDNENWAVIYFCIQYPFLKSEMSVVLTRSREEPDEDTNLAINQAIQSAQLNLLDYKKSTNIGCGPNEPEL